MIKSEIKNMLVSVSDEKYRAFTEKLKSSNSAVLGVRMGVLRKTAKELAKENWKEYVLSVEEDDSYEEKLIGGMSIYYSKCSINEKTEYTEQFRRFIYGWGICDSICSTIKLKEEERETFWNYCKECTQSGEEFKTRFGLVAMLGQFVTEEKLDDIFNIVSGINYIGYYVSMGAAWLLAECMAFYPQITLEFMKNNTLDNWVYNKSITKMRESFRVSDEMKSMLKTMVRK